MAEEAHPIRNGVIVGVIVLFIGPLVNQIFGWWPWLQRAIASAATAIWHFLTASLPIPVWALILIAIALTPTAVFLGRLLRKQEGPTWRDYREDMFLGVKWRWRYEGGSIEDLRCYCPADDTALVYCPVPPRNPDEYNRTSLRCESCQQEIGSQPGDMYDVKDRVIRQIERKVRVGEWRNALGAEEGTA